MGRSVWCSFSWGEPMFAQDRAPKVGLHIGTTSSECAVSIRLHLGSTLAKMAPTAAQFRPTWLQLRPTYRNLALGWTIWEQFGPSWGPHGFKMEHMASQIRNRCVSVGPNLREAVAKAFQACWAWLGLSYASHGFNLGTIWDRFGTSAQHDQLATWAPVGSKTAQPRPNGFWLWWGFVARSQLGGRLGPSWSQQARVRCKFCPSWAQVGSCSAQVKAKDGQVWPSRLWLGQVALVGPNSLGAGGSRHEATQIKFLYN